MAKSIVGEDFFGTGSPTASGTVTWPTTAAGDFAVIGAACYQQSTAWDFDTPTGFTLLLGDTGIESADTGGATSIGAIFYKECDGTETGDITVSVSGGSGSTFIGGTLVVYRGDSALTFKASSLGTLARGNSSDAAATSAGVDAAVGDLIIMVSMLSDPPGATNSDPSGLSLVAEGNTATNTAWIHGGEASSAGATGTKTWDFTNTRSWIAYQFLAEEAGGSSPTVEIVVPWAQRIVRHSGRFM